jgi:hypothetical protein
MTDQNKRPYGNTTQIGMKGPAAHHTGLGPAQGKPTKSPGHGGVNYSKDARTVRNQRKTGDPY